MDFVFYFSFGWFISYVKKIWCDWMRKIINKKGEITTKQIVVLIVLIASFAVILFLLFRLNLGAETDKEICHNSVILKSKGKGLVGGLDCKTGYVCISGGGECEGINPTETINVDAEDKNEIMKAIADEMADCWWMFGEGEQGYLGTDLQGDHCAICSIVGFDNSINSEFPEITYEEFYNYLLETKKGISQSYLKYLYDVFDVESVKNLNTKMDIDEGKIFTDDKFATITGINPNWPRTDRIVYPYFIKYDEVSEKTSCDVFDITKS